MKSELKVFGAVAITSFIIVYICTIFLNKKYEVSSNNNLLSISNRAEEKTIIVEENNIEIESKSDIVEENIDQVEEDKSVLAATEITKVVKENKIVVENRSGLEELGMQIVNYAIQFVGNPYVYGGNSLTNGTDCSGFVKLIFAHFNISLPRTTGEQAQSGQGVSLENRQPGDIISYGYNGTSSHSAIHIGNDKVVHAATPSQGIIYGNLYMMPIVAIRRVI